MTENTQRAVVIHASDSTGDVDRAVSTAASLRESFPDARIRIIINGEALNAVPPLDASGLPAEVELGVCVIGLRKRGIAETDVPDGVEVVPAAPLAIVEEQFNGAAYLRL